MLFLPELSVLLSGLIFFIVSLARPNSQTIRTLSIGLAAVVLVISAACFSQNGSLFFDSYRIDLFSQLFKLLIAAATLAVLVFSGQTPGIKEDVRAEYYLFLFMGVLGLMMLVSSVELLSIFIALELSSFAVYIMVPMRKTASNTIFQMESGIKYLLFGIMSTGFMLFGMSYLFGLTGSTYLDEIATSLTFLFNQPAALIAMLMVLFGFFYKLAIFPFHFWVPDVYEGAANETTAFIAAVPKIAATALLVRLISMVSAEGQVMANILLVCSIGSMFYGNLSALVQKDIKRMLGFSGISHAGFVLFGLLTFGTVGYATSLYYIMGYVAMNLACFLVICTVATHGDNLQIDDLTGLHKRSPFLAITLATGLFALAGIPPFVGFTGKFMLLVNAFKQGYTIPVILAAINTGIAIYYYLSVVRVAYCSDPDKDMSPISQPWLGKAAATILLIIIIVMGVMPGRFLNLASAAVSTLLP